jgi:hypothetical protein
MTLKLTSRANISTNNAATTTLRCSVKPNARWHRADGKVCAGFVEQGTQAPLAKTLFF